MSIEDQIKGVLFNIGRDVKLHKIDNDNIILEINYEKYTEELMRIFESLSKD